MSSDPNTAEPRGCPTPGACSALAEIKRLRSALEDVCAAQPIWNGGIAKHRPEYLYGFIEDLREIAREGLRNG